MCPLRCVSHGAEHIFREYKHALAELGLPYADMLVLEWAGSLDGTGKGLADARYVQNHDDSPLNGVHCLCILWCGVVSVSVFTVL